MTEMQNPRHLTPKEREIAGLVAQSLRNREIAERLFNSEQTVKNHLRSIFKKLGIQNRRQLMAHAAANLQIQAPAPDLQARTMFTPTALGHTGKP